MFQLAYISSSKDPVDQILLDQILSVSRRNNERVGVSGLLVSGGRRFLQVLEGPEQAVLATYTRIQRDDRHRAFVILSATPVQERAFGDWSMAYSDGQAGGEFEKLVKALVEKIADPNLRAQFTGFAKLHSRAA
jgi:hypothetical protein